MNKLGLFVLVLLPVPLAFSQQPSARAAEPSASAVQVITLGNSVVPLERGWKFQPGDSPWVNGAPVWAQPGFDDARWAAMDLTPKAGAVDMVFGTSGYVPGWTRKGYPHLSGYAWYRLRVRVKDPSQPLWLKMPDDFDDAVQIYANGRYVGQFGDFSPGHVTGYFAEPISFALPPPGPDGTVLVAMRFYMAAYTALSNPDVGGMHGPPALGLASAVLLMQAAGKDVLLKSEFSSFLVALLDLLLAPLSLWAWFYNRRSHVWLWLFLALAWRGLNAFQGNLAALTTIIPDSVSNGLALVVLPLMAMFWWHWFGLEEKRWIPRAAWLLAMGATFAYFLAESPSLVHLVPRAALPWCNDAGIGFGAGVHLLEVIILVEGFRRDRFEALLAATPILLGVFVSSATYLEVAFHIPNEFFPFGLGIQVGDMVNFLEVCIIFALALRRFMRTQVQETMERDAVTRDLEQAHQLQQRVLVPEAVTSTAFAVETEYHPAQTVGGDFFQTLTRPDGTLLVVIGDVSGKGVSASMLVAVLVGAIRSQAEHSFDPQAMLATLNRRMMGRSGGHFATCLAAEIAPDGTLRMANAGHLAPYLNGQEMEMEGSLPLGFRETAEYPAQTVRLQPGDRLTFMTDGVVEATNAARELFGFERAQQASHEPAAAIVQQARSFGQEDDITVVRVAFAAA
ncbi:MAG: PP2C family protein-serine/threonine phosphatase [Acidobacteriaceae bacterium]